MCYHGIDNFYYFLSIIAKCLLVTVCAVRGCDDVVGVDECPSAAGQGRLARVHERRHPGVLVHTRVGAVDDPAAATAGLAAHWIDKGEVTTKSDGLF